MAAGVSGWRAGSGQRGDDRRTPENVRALLAGTRESAGGAGRDPWRQVICASAHRPATAHSDVAATGRYFGAGAVDGTVAVVQRRTRARLCRRPGVGPWPGMGRAGGRRPPGCGGVGRARALADDRSPDRRGVVRSSYGQAVVRGKAGLLTGGRLDYLDGRPVAALVYQYQRHIINLFSWPAPQAGDTPAAVEVRQGYNQIHWTQAGMTYWAVSDLNAEELHAFVQLVQHQSGPTPTR